MITDEQVKTACNRLNERHSYTVASEKAVREVLTTYEQSKWVGTEKSLPSKTGNYVTDIGLVHFDSDEKVWCVFNTNGYPDYDVNVAYWQPLPEFKE